MPEAWIVATRAARRARQKGLTRRSPSGRSRRDHRPRRAGEGPLARSGARRGRDPRCAQPAGRRGITRPRRSAACRDGCARHHREPVLRVLAASDPHGHPRIRAGEGDAMVAGGVECVSRFAKGKADGMIETKEPALRHGRDASVYIAMGETRRTSPTARTCPAGRWTRSRSSRSARPCGQERGSFARGDQRDHPAGLGAWWSETTDLARTRRWRSSAPWPGVPRGWTVTAGNACPSTTAPRPSC